MKDVTGEIWSVDGISCNERGANSFFPREKWGESQKTKEGVGEGFGSRTIFRAGKTSKIPFLWLSLLSNPTETLATQANSVG